MSANVETMFSVRETPWHGLGRIVMDAPASREALELAGLDWQVESRNIYSGTGAMIPGYRANVRSTDDAVLGVVSDRYRIVQNEEAFQFTDDLLGEGVTYETAGSLQGGKKVWMLAKLPEKYIIAGDEVTPYLVFFNSHDGSSGVKVAMTPVRVVCQNTLNLALGTAKRIWTARHTENVLLRVQDARETLQLANSYMGELGKGIHELTTIKLSDRKVQEFINEFFPVAEDLTDGQRKNNLRLQEDLKARYYNAPDLEWVGKNGWRFVNAVSDFATHADPIRKTRNYNENLFLRTAEGNPMIDKAYNRSLHGHGVVRPSVVRRDAVDAGDDGYPCRTGIGDKLQEFTLIRIADVAFEVFARIAHALRRVIQRGGMTDDLLLEDGFQDDSARAVRDALSDIGHSRRIGRTADHNGTRKVESEVFCFHITELH